MPRKLWLLPLTLLLAGCPKPPQIIEKPVYVPVPYDCGQPPLREKLITVPVRWVIVPLGTENLFTLTPEQYTNLGTNVSNVILGIQQLKAELGFYRGCIADSQLTSDPEPRTD